LKKNFPLISSISNLNRISILNIAIIITIIFLSSFLFVYPCGDIQQFIGHADEANLADLARNIAIGKGAVVNNAWLLSNGGMKGNVLPQPEPYWSLYPAYLIAIFFKLFGYSRDVFILPALLMRAIIMALCLFLVRNQTKSWPACFLITFILAFTNTLNKYVNGLSDIYLACFMSLSIFLLAIACSRAKSSNALFVGSGILAGASIGIKITGIFTFSALLVLIIRLFNSNNLKQYLKQIFLYLIGSITGLSGYIFYNLKNFGSVLPGGYRLASEAGQIKHALEYSGTDYLSAINNAFYNPDITLKNIENPPSFLIYIQTNLKQFIVNFFINGHILQTLCLIFATCGMFIVFRKTQKNGFQILNITEWFILLSIPILLCGLALGFLVPWQARYWLFCSPFILISFIFVIHNLLRKPNLIYISLAILSLPWTYFGTSKVIVNEFKGGYVKYSAHKNPFYDRRCYPLSNAYEKVTNLIPNDSIVLTSNPWQFSFHTGLRSVMFPYTDNLNSIEKVAMKYEARFIAILDDDARSKILKEKLFYKENKMFDLFYDDKNLQIFNIILRDN